MHALKDLEESEIVVLNPNDKRSRRVQRWRAYEQGESLPLVCATIPIIGTDKVVELFRSPKKRVMPSEWIFFLSEHQKASDDSARTALERGFKEEVGYDLRRKRLFDPDERINLRYKSIDCRRHLLWKAGLYVVPIIRLSELTPDQDEILDIRERPLEEVLRDVYKKGSPYKRFNPEKFFKTLEKHTRYIMENI